MMEKTVRCGELGIQYGEGKVLLSGPLGAGVAVVILDSSSRTAGLVHVALPTNLASNSKAMDRPGFFAGSAVPFLLSALRKSGISRDASELTVKIVGGANVLDHSGVLDLGERNVQAVQKAIEQANLRIEAAKTGGRFSRSVKVHVETGMVEMITPGQESVFI